MRRLLGTVAALLLCVFAGAARADERTDDVGARLAEWLALVSPSGADLPASRYAAFLTERPVWPERGRILRRYQQALSKPGDPAERQRLCPLVPLTLMPAFLACAASLPDAPAEARRLWVSGAGSEGDEAAFLARFGAELTADDQWRRYAALESQNPAAARRQIARLPQDRQMLALARLAAKQGSAEADALFDALPPQTRADPALILYRLHALRRAARLDDALALWSDAGAPLQAASPSHDWSAERNVLARALLLTGRASDAAPLADDETLPESEIDRQEARLLTGTIALRFLHDPARAEAAFAPLRRARSIQMQARGRYWVARARQAKGDADGATEAYREAARFPTTFCGQLALAALSGEAPSFVAGQPAGPGTRSALAAALRALPAPEPGRPARPDLAEAAEILAGQGDRTHAGEFLLLLLGADSSPENETAAADLGVRLGLPAVEVAAGHALARAGVALYPQSYPEGYPEPDGAAGSDLPARLPDGLLPAVIRQESGFDPAAVSGAHAVGLLQLLPAAARDVARRGHLRGLDLSANGLLDPETNVTVGSAYVAQLLARFGGALPYALAAYNAGPHRVDLWLEADPRPAPPTVESLLDWITLLPYRETRLYVENIEANMMIYRMREAEGSH